MTDVVRDRRFLRRLRVLSLVEGVSTLVLFFVAMPLKYLGGMPLWVTIAGAVHGALFTTLAATFLLGAERVPLGRRLAWRGVLAAVLPFGPFVFDRALRRLDDPAA